MTGGGTRTLVSLALLHLHDYFRVTGKHVSLLDTRTHTHTHARHAQTASLQPTDWFPEHLCLAFFIFVLVIFIIYYVHLFPQIRVKLWRPRLTRCVGLLILTWPLVLCVGNIVLMIRRVVLFSIWKWAGFNIDAVSLKRPRRIVNGMYHHHHIAIASLCVISILFTTHNIVLFRFGKLTSLFNMEGHFSDGAVSTRVRHT